MSSLVTAVEGEIRTYRVSRVQGTRVTGQPGVRPEACDLGTYWEESIARFRAGLPRYPATVRVRPDIVPAMRRLRYARIEEASPPDADGWVTVSVQFDTEDEACGYVLRFGPQIEVLEPGELRERVIDLSERVVALYVRSPHTSVRSRSDPDRI